jgi:hypothetical protein
MGTINLIVGLITIGIGFLVKSSPNLIAGYNTMSEDKKKNVDIKGASTFVRNGFIIIGLTIIIGYYFFKWIGFDGIANNMILISILVGVTIIVVKGQKFDHNKHKHPLLIYFILGITITFVSGLLIYGSVPTKTIVINDKILFTGMYGFEMRNTDISGVELSDKIPPITLRTNGFSFGGSKKGTFRLNEFGKCKLFLQSDKGPFLIISDKNGEKTIINDKNSKVTEENFGRIKALINN